MLISSNERPQLQYTLWHFNFHVFKTFLIPLFHKIFEVFWPLELHNAVMEIVPRQYHTKFDNKDVQSTILTILVENQILMLSGKWSKYGPKNGAYFIKVAYRRYHFRETFVSGKVFATMHLRKKLVSNFRNPDSDYIISRFFEIFETLSYMVHS